MRFLFSLIFSGILFTASATEIRIISWNVFLTPTIAHRSDQKNRAGEIAKYLADSKADILVLEEMFHGKAAQLIEDKLKENGYPYFTRRSKGGFLKTHSGVRIFSKFPIDSVKYLVYKDAAGSDRLAKKGAVMACITIEGKPIQVIGTHMQSSDKPKMRAARKKQFHQLATEFLDVYALPDVPQILAGDLNVDQYFIEEYLEMMDILNTQEYRLEGTVRMSWDGANNDLGRKFFGSHQQLLDYIFIRNKSGFMQMVWQQILCPKQPEDSGMRYTDYSDHYPVEAKLRF